MQLQRPRTRQARITTIVAGVLVLVGLATVPAATGLALAYFYVLTAPLGVLSAPLRARVFGPDSVAPRRTRQQSVFLPLVEPEEPDALPAE